jgi:hypothetical protein
MAYGGYAGFMDSMLFANIGLFAMVVPLFDEQMTLIEYLVRALGLAGIWLLHHASGQSSWGLLAMAAMVVILVLMRLGKDKIRYRARTLMAVSTFVALLIGTRYHR